MKFSCCLIAALVSFADASEIVFKANVPYINGKEISKNKSFEYKYIGDIFYLKAIKESSFQIYDWNVNLEKSGEILLNLRTKDLKWQGGSANKINSLLGNTYLVKPEDIINVKIRNINGLKENFVVDFKGDIQIGLINQSFHVEGMADLDIQALFSAKLNKIIENPQITVEIIPKIKHFTVVGKINGQFPILKNQKLSIEKSLAICGFRDGAVFLKRHGDFVKLNLTKGTESGYLVLPGDIISIQ